MNEFRNEAKNLVLGLDFNSQITTAEFWRKGNKGFLICQQTTECRA
jgi:hypothetical protein